MNGGAYGETSGTTVRESRTLMEQLLVFSLPEEIAALRDECRASGTDRASRTLAKDVDFRALLSVLDAGATLDQHHGDARASIQLLDGSALLDVDGQQTELSAGRLAVVDSGYPWTLRATSNCAVLLTLAWPVEKAGV